MVYSLHSNVAQFINRKGHVTTTLGPCKGIIGFWIPPWGFRISGTGYRILVNGTWTPDSGFLIVIGISVCLS